MDIIKQVTLNDIADYSRGTAFGRYRMDTVPVSGKETEYWKALAPSCIVSLPLRNVVDASSGTYRFVPKHDLDVSPMQRIHANDILITMNGLTASSVGRVAIVPADFGRDFITSASLGLLRVKDASVVSPRYLYHVLTGSTFRDYVRDSLPSAASLNNMSAKALRQFPIALPSLKRQEAIIRAIEAMRHDACELVENLTRQMEMCEDRYGEYRDALLDPTGATGRDASMPTASGHDKANGRTVAIGM